MQKIRIGNDVRLTIQLRLPNESLANIKSAKVFFINDTLQQKIKQEHEKKNRFIGRFPIEPFVNEFEPTAYNINSSGNPRYNVIVNNHYNGFGLHPDWKNCLPFKGENVTEYLADVQHESNQNTITTMFPAEAQLFAGIYKLVVVAQIYKAGYKNNIQTVTTQYDNIFELCKNEGLNYAVSLVIGDTETDNPENPGTHSSEDIYVESGSYDGANTITLQRSGGAQDIDINIGLLTDWYIDESSPFKPIQS